MNAGTGTGPLVVLVGPPGAGKTTVGLLLAERFAVAFRDTDADIEKTAGKPIPDIFVDDGEPHFRALEHQAVADALVGHDGVLALGGGAVMDPATRALLAAHKVAFLDVELADAVRRVGLDAPRPLLVGNPRARWRELMAQRRPLYEEVATVVVATAGRTPEQVADELAAVLAAAATAGPASAHDEPEDQER
ncbi:shikimate kinase [Yinghuangia seranimata]|uniref:shikimate kinase n=1 Tax=Yinghuangia seranimata TaxID=408067 RepID=UPI00248C3172|nr:shikimate kinase [Yinghuangia seranimata]MDI2132084.1 shikimate kinase [Yinghuangia seranimata]